MGNSIANSISEKQKGMMEEMQKNQMKGAERQRKVMMSMQQAFVRESLNWTLPTYGFCLLAVIGLVSKQKIPRFAMGPFVPIGVLLAYQCDLAYGNKLERVNASFEQILAEKHGITLPKEETKEAKGLVKSA